MIFGNERYKNISIIQVTIRAGKFLSAFSLPAAGRFASRLLKAESH
jgi:hypothetical protein